MATKRVQSRPKKPQYRRTFLREWREHGNKTLEQAGEAVGISHAQLGRIERGLQPYNQGLLERLADLYLTSPESLLMRRPPKEGDNSIWSLWDQAKQGQREDIEKYAEFVVKSRTGT